MTHSAYVRMHRTSPYHTTPHHTTSHYLVQQPTSLGSKALILYLLVCNNNNCFEVSCLLLEESTARLYPAKFNQYFLSRVIMQWVVIFAAHVIVIWWRQSYSSDFIVRFYRSPFTGRLLQVWLWSNYCSHVINWLLKKISAEIIVQCAESACWQVPW